MTGQFNPISHHKNAFSEIIQIEREKARNAVQPFRDALASLVGHPMDERMHVQLQAIKDELEMVHIAHRSYLSVELAQVVIQIELALARARCALSKNTGDDLRLLRQYDHEIPWQAKEI